MRRSIVSILMSAALLAASAVQAQDRPAAAPPAGQPPTPPATAPAPAQRPPSAAGPTASLEVQVVISRYQGEKRVSSLPYALALVANREAAELNIGADVPVPNATFTPMRQEGAPPREPAASTPGAPATPAAPPSDAAARGPAAPTPPRPAQPMTSYSYRTAGTTIRCVASGGAGGEYQVSVSIDESSVLPGDQASRVGSSLDQLPVFRNIRSRNMLLLRDGQTRQYVAASDRVSGEVVRVDVTLREVK